jgi:hypothetical protein
VTLTAVRTRLIVLVVLLAGCGGGGHSPIYSPRQVKTAFEQAGITLRVTHRPPPGYEPKQGPLRHVTVLSGGIEGDPHAEVIVFVFGLAAGEAADLLRALQAKAGSEKQPEHNFAAASGNVVVAGGNIARRERSKLTAAMKNLSSRA